MIRLPAPSPESLATEIRLVREQALSRVTEVDLLVVALRDHIKDLQDERDFLRAELLKAQQAVIIANASWMQRGQKSNR